jgi:hypothetical protein
VLLLVGGFLLAGVGDGDKDKLQTAASEESSDTSIGARRRSTTTTIESEATDDTTDATDGGSGDDEGADEGDDGDGATDGGGSTTTAPPNPGGGATGGTDGGTTTGPTTTATTAAPVEIKITDFRLGRRPIFTTRCQQAPTTVLAEAFVSGSPTKVRMVVTRSGDPGAGGIVNMSSAGGGKWTATLGPYATGDGDVHIVAQAFGIRDGKEDLLWTHDADVAVTDCPPSTPPTSSSSSLPPRPS